MGTTKRPGGHRGNYRIRADTRAVWKNIPELQKRGRNDGRTLECTRTKCVLKLIKNGTAMREAREEVSSMTSESCLAYLKS